MRQKTIKFEDEECTIDYEQGEDIRYYEDEGYAGYDEDGNMTPFADGCLYLVVVDKRGYEWCAKFQYNGFVEVDEAGEPVKPLEIKDFEDDREGLLPNDVVDINTLDTISECVRYREMAEG